MTLSNLLLCVQLVVDVLWISCIQQVLTTRCVPRLAAGCTTFTARGSEGSIVFRIVAVFRPPGTVVPGGLMFYS